MVQSLFGNLKLVSKLVKESLNYFRTFNRKVDDIMKPEMLAYKKLTGHTDEVSVLRVIDVNLFASGSLDTKIIIWQVKLF